MYTELICLHFLLDVSFIPKSNACYRQSGNSCLNSVAEVNPSLCTWTSPAWFYLPSTVTQVLMDSYETLGPGEAVPTCRNRDTCVTTLPGMCRNPELEPGSPSLKSCTLTLGHWFCSSLVCVFPKYGFYAFGYWWVPAEECASQQGYVWGTEIVPET